MNYQQGEFVEELREDELLGLGEFGRGVDFQLGVSETALVITAGLCHGDETFHEAAEFLRADRGGLDGFVFDQAACEVVKCKSLLNSSIKF